MIFSSFLISRKIMKRNTANKKQFHSRSHLNNYTGVSQDTPAISRNMIALHLEAESPFKFLWLSQKSSVAKHRRSGGGCFCLCLVGFPTPLHEPKTPRQHYHHLKHTRFETAQQTSPALLSL